MKKRLKIVDPEIVKFEGRVLEDSDCKPPFRVPSLKLFLDRVTFITSKSTDFIVTVDPRETLKHLKLIIESRWDKIVIRAPWSNEDQAKHFLEHVYSIAEKTGAKVIVNTGYDFVTTDFKGNMIASRY
jgi:hypothetical protein